MVPIIFNFLTTFFGWILQNWFSFLWFLTNNLFLIDNSFHFSLRFNGAKHFLFVQFSKFFLFSKYFWKCWFYVPIDDDQHKIPLSKILVFMANYPKKVDDWFLIEVINFLKNQHHYIRKETLWVFLLEFIFKKIHVRGIHDHSSLHLILIVSSPRAVN